MQWSSFFWRKVLWVFMYAWILVTTTTDKMQKNVHTWGIPLSCPFVFRPSLHPEPRATTYLFPVPAFLPFPKCHINGIIQYVPIWGWVLSLNIRHTYFFFIFKRTFIFAEDKIREYRRDSATAGLTRIVSWHPKRNGEVPQTLLNHCFPSSVTRASSI